MKQRNTIKVLLTAIFAMVFVLGVGVKVSIAQYSINFDGASDATSSNNYGFTDHNLNGITWTGVQAIIPTTPLAAEWFNGVRSLRMRGYGTSSMTMTENKTNGLGSLSFNYRRYGTDPQVDWRVEYSTNNGDTWTQIGSDFTAPATDDVQTFNETVNVTGNVRIRIKRATETGTANRRLNIDDITLTDFVLSPTLTSEAASSITQTAAILNGNITNNGGANITRRGFKVSDEVDFDPETTGDDVSETGSFSTGAFNLSATGLTTGTTYYFRAYAENSAGRTYGEQLNFTTSTTATAPLVEINATTLITATGATLNAEVTADGGDAVTSRGFVISSTDTKPELDESGVTNITSGDGIGSFSETISELLNNTLYYVQVYAQNTVGITYNGIEEFITLPGAPQIEEGSEAAITAIVANWSPPTVTGNQSYTYTVQLSTSTDFTSPVAEESGIASSQTSYTFTGLNANTEYFYRVRTVNSTGPSAWSSTSSGIATLINAATLASFGTTYEQNFSGFISAATLPIGWSVNASGSANNRLDYSPWANGGNNNTGVKFSTANANVLGYQHTGTTGLFTATLLMTNNTGKTIYSLEVGYLGLVERPTEGRSPEWTVVVAGNTTPSLSYSTSSSADETRSATITGLNIPNGETFTITWSSDRDESGAGASRQIGISDVSVTPVFAQTISPNAGYRLMSAPGQVSFASMFSNVWLQGMSEITGNGSPLTSQASNILTYNENTREFVQVKDASTIPAAGTGFIYYHFNDDNFDGVANASASIVSVGAVENNAPAVNLSYTATGDAADRGWNLIGNPFATNIDAFSIANGNASINNVIYVYDRSYGAPTGPDVTNSGAAGGAYRVWNGTAGTLTDGRVAPFQAFWVQVTESVSDLAIGSDLKTTDAATFYKDRSSNGVIQIAATSAFGNSEAWITIDSEASVGLDSRDAYKLMPLDLQPYLNLATQIDDNLFDINNIPFSLNEAIEIPLHVDLKDVDNRSWVSVSGDVSLTWPSIQNLPDGWVLELVDTEIGKTVNMLESESYSLQLSETLRKASPQEPSLLPSVQKVDGGSRLIIRVGPAVPTSVEAASDLPTELVLSQNYPNPFNPTSRIDYQLPEASHVRLSVFDLLGREVAVLVNESMNAGSHFVNIDASNLSSGVYVYRLQAGGQVITRKMTLVK